MCMNIVWNTIQTVFFEKAFDSIEWNFLFKTLKQFNFGDNFIKWRKILFTKPIFSIKNNGWISIKAIKASWTKRLVDQSCILNRIINRYLETKNIDVNYLLTLTERKVKDFTIISSIPAIYKEVFCCFNECKRKYLTSQAPISYNNHYGTMRFLNIKKNQSASKIGSTAISYM